MTDEMDRFCSFGHLIAGDNALEESKGKGQGRRVRCRRCNYDKRRLRMGKGPKTVTPEELVKQFARLAPSRAVRKKAPTGTHKTAKSRMEVWVEVVQKYGGKCVCCGETNHMFLSIDHINGGGREEARLMGTEGIKKMMLEKDMSATHRILCFNCNMGRARQSGVCPHGAKNV